MEKLLNYEGLEKYNEKVQDQLETKAEIDGYYEEMTVGNAEQLISNVYVEDSEAYKYRTSGGSADIGNREYDEIVGGTVAWNQLEVDNFTDESLWESNATGTISVEDNILTFALTDDLSDTSKYVKYTGRTDRLPTGHKGLVTVDIYPSKSTTTRISYSSVANGTKPVTCEADIWTQNVAVLDSINNASMLLYISVNGSLHSGDTIKFRNFNVFDLTQMFGTAIANYIYSLEQSTAGAGVAWFRKYFPEPYYAYNSGELISVEGLSSHDMVGFNQYNNGTAKVLGGNQYQITGTYTALSLDGETITPDSNGLFIPSATGTLTVTGGGDDTCVHLTWSGSRNGDYEKYVKHSYALDSSLTLRGIPKLSDGKLTFDGDVYASDGTVTRKYDIVDLGTLNWEVNGNHFRTRMPVAPKINNAKITCICHKYTTITGNNVSPALSARTTSISISTYNGTAYPLIIIDDDYSTASALKTALSGVYLVYELATPTTETAEPYQSPQIVDDYGTEEYVSTTIVPVRHNTKYMANSVDKLNHLPTLADSDGDYVIRQSGTQMSLIPLTQVKELPDAPSADGTYALKATVTDGTATYSWEVAE